MNEHLYENKLPQELMGEWEKRNTLYKKIAQRVKGSDSVLDLGCSTGYGGKHLKYSSYYDGVDNAKDPIDFAKANYAKFRTCHYHYCDAEIFMHRCPNRHYRIVICTDMLHHNLGKERSLLEEMVRVTDRLLFLQMRETQEFRVQDAIDAVRSKSPKVQYQELLHKTDNADSLIMFSGF